MNQRKFSSFVLLLILSIYQLNFDSLTYIPTPNDFIEPYANFNKQGENRINLSFYFNSDQDMESRKAMTERYLRVNGPIIESKIDGSVGPLLGLFQLYPFSVNKNKFNIYISKLNADYGDIESTIDNAKDDHAIFSHKLEFIKDRLGDADIDYRVIRMFYTNNLKELDLGNTFSHELAHSLLKFDDEYEQSYYFGDQCVNDIKKAERLWGDMKGEVSKSFYDTQQIFKGKLTTDFNGFIIPQFNFTEDNVKIGVINSNCGESYTPSYKSSKDNIMNLADNNLFFNAYQEKLAIKILSNYGTEKKLYLKE